MSQWRKGQKEGMIARLIADGRLPAGIDAARVAVAGVDAPLLEAPRIHPCSTSWCCLPRNHDGECQRAEAKKPGKKRMERNKTEARFERLLEARLARGEIVSFEFQGRTLRWPDAMRYTPDFLVVDEIGDIDGKPLVAETLIEVKGAHQWAKDVIKFRAARDKWGHLYCFEFWQEIDGQWQETR